MIVSTLCYIEDNGKYLMLLRNKKQKDVNKGKWIGVGGRIEPGESPEYIFVFTSDEYSGNLKECDEGELRWIDKEEIMKLNLWEGDRIFLKNMLDDGSFFSMRLSYKEDRLTDHIEHYY